MGKALHRTLKIAAVIIGLTAYNGEAKALAVECAGCVAAANETTAAVNQVNATLETIKGILTTIQNHLNHIRLAVGPAATVASQGTLAQAADYRNFATLKPSFESLDLDKGVSLDFGDLDGLKSNLNQALQIYTDAERIKEAVEKGRYVETVADIQRITRRRNNLYSEAIERVLSSGYYSLSQSDAAKSTELSLDQNRRGALTLQAKANAASKVQVEILGRLNHLIALIASQNAMNGASNLKGLPRDLRGQEALEPPPPQGATQIFGGTK